MQIKIPRDPRTAEEQAKDFIREARRLEREALKYRMFAHILRTGKKPKPKRRKRKETSRVGSNSGDGRR